MSVSIPYDPSLQLTNIVDDDKLKILKEIGVESAKIDAAEDTLNAAVLTLRSFQMTLAEMADMGIDTKDLSGKIDDAKKAVQAAAKDVVDKRIAGYEAINQKRVGLATVGKSFESPVDYNKTQIKKMPLSIDSLKLDAQYFSFDANDQDAQSTMSSLKAFVSASTSVLGAKKSGEISTAASMQVANQHANHSLEGTLVIVASCNHKDAALLAPFVLDVDKAIRVWNQMQDEDTKRIKTNSVASMQTIAEKQETAEEPTINIVSGATYGSSFVGMVHVLKVDETSSSQNMITAAASLQAQMETGGWFSSMSGGFGVDSQFANDVKRMLSTQNITSHVSVITMGTIPSIKSNEVQIGVKTFADFDPVKMMDNLATLANATATEQKSVQQGAQAARTGQQMVEIQATNIKSAVLGLGEIDDGKNKMLDINTLMTALEDYIAKALSGDIGVPVMYYLKPITASQLAQMWVAKYFPGQYLTAAGDDSDNGNVPTPTPPSPSPSPPAPAPTPQ
jgi:hypothetical protein